ncbi:Kelch motif [Glarea lozoyensis ATCC 20868]|uniref:Kelch motif n=1 Tax=Glarea lozoyensis (strain ATCC 20868 / MF5171) TaxID=1116229 RepID=S3D698_GLAL2|nr:Kelch motif [Glarea lozoyensis ATCC 20868]EPE27586.1 Kelch motif [Glarea lozoyensis ATCC 20868]
MMELTTTVATVAHGMAQNTHPLQAKWSRIDGPPLPRSSHSLSVVSGRAYIFGGEIDPREPVDNDMHVIVLPSGTVSSADYRSIPAKADTEGGQVPEKRVGHTAAVIGERIFVFGGRGGKDMKPLEEGGRVWVYNTRTDSWSYLDPEPGTPYPAARSYHTSVAIEKPEPGNMKSVKVDNATELPRVGKIAESAQTVEQEGGYGTLFVHAGCPNSGRTNDLWGFDVRSKTWKAFPDAPGSPRGGTSLAVSKQRIFRYGGFNGTGEEGGELDFLELKLDQFSSLGGSEETGVSAKGTWTTLNFTEENMQCPGNRSVAGLQTITTGMGREYLILFMGERDPSNDGHNAAGNFWGDIWCFQCPPLGMTAASFKDATWQALGRETGEGKWSQVMASDSEGVEGEDVHNLVPGERGWFASSILTDLDQSAIILWGGLNGKNEREDNGWILSFT